MAFYGLIWATLGILAMSAYRYYKEGNYKNIIALGIVSLLLVLGSVKFFNLETTQHQEYYKIQQRDFQRAIQEDYPYNKAFYDSLYLAVTGSTETLPDNVSLSKNKSNNWQTNSLPLIGSTPHSGRMNGLSFGDCSF
ncbi:MAG: hypothetical protein IPJ40_14455 [Saprospirales bacterium]|nr:hypothetical protein [Saprospirales bacterium]